MSKFLKEVAEYLFQSYGSDLNSVSIVFPNRRAGLFFQKYLSELTDKPLFSPDILTISELIDGISNLRLVDQNTLVVELFRVFQRITNTSETLDEFYYWGEMLLADFNDIDKYLVDTRQLFANIKTLREIDFGFDFLSEEQLKFLSTFWANILTAKDSENKQQFLGIWEKLIQIYTEFRQQLENKEWAYEGLLYRNMAEKLDETSFAENNKYAFVGFNALNKCEKNLFDFLNRNATVSFFWDYDTYYTEAKFHEAAMFIDTNIQMFPMPETFEVSANNFSSLKEIDLVSVPGFSGQATFAANWLEENAGIVNNRFDNTALVLCDETLLLPMLNSVPENISELNITMGFPIKNSPAYALVKGLIDIDRSSRDGKKGEIIYYYRNVLSLLSNPLLKEFLGDWYDKFVTGIRNENKIYLTKSDFDGVPLLTEIFTLPEKVEDCKMYLQGIVKWIFSSTVSDDSLIKESLYQLHLSLNRLHDALFGVDNQIGLLYSKKLYYQLLLRQLDRVTIPFEGEPLSGVQLMGFLETRCLDFDNLILLSFNDDKLPGKSHQHSFIPYSLRKGFGLPVIEQKTAMFSYYFYRLLQRAKKVTLVYDSRSGGMSGGEVSRFVTQLKYEAKHLKVIDRQGVFNFEPSENRTIQIRKDPAILEELVQYFNNKRISPSALNTYLDCRLKFYFKYIERIVETEDVMEDIDHLVFGRIAHLALEELYMPYVGKEITENILRDLLKNEKKLNQCLNLALEKEYFKKGNFQLNGRNLLVYDIIRKYVIRILKHDLDLVPFKLIGLEEIYENTIEINESDKKLTVRFGGTVDRLDQVKDKIRVVDYKTGASENAVQSIEKLFLPGKKRNKAAFQTMVYANCVHAKLKTNLSIVPAVYGARSIFTKDFNPEFQIHKGDLIYQANAVAFEEQLKILFEEIVSSTELFSQVDDKQLCSYCEFNGICNR